MTNYQILASLKSLATLMRLNNYNTFKVKAILDACVAIEKQKREISELTQDEIAQIKGIGPSITKKIIELSTNGYIAELKALEQRTPSGLLDLLKLGGLGPVSVLKLWEKHNITSIDSLKEALKKQKLFTPKLSSKLVKEIEFFELNRGRVLYSEALDVARVIIKKLEAKYKNIGAYIVGELRRQNPVISTVELLVQNTNIEDLEADLLSLPSIDIKSFENRLDFCLKGLKCKIHVLKNGADFYKEYISLTGDDAFVSHCFKELSLNPTQVRFNTESELFKHIGLPFIPANMREEHNFKVIKNFPKSIKPAELISLDKIKGLLHNHSTYSDGLNSIQEMAEECIKMGYEYFGICDHSKAAAYANGLSEARIEKQITEIDKLNKKLHPFKIFKGMEVDILKDGKLDYDDNILRLFDFIVVSVHSNLDMSAKEATERIIQAVSNPFVDILAHPTGRLLTKRTGYTLNFEKIFTACQAYNVNIELNCAPKRLDLDWHHISAACAKNILISLNPDAHSAAGLHNIYYGVEVARKAALSTKMCLNALGKTELELIFRNKRGFKLTA